MNVSRRRHKRARRTRTAAATAVLALAALLIGCPPVGEDGGEADVGVLGADAVPHLPGDAGAGADGTGRHGCSPDADSPDATCVAAGDVCTPGESVCCAGTCQEYTVYDWPRCLPEPTPPAPDWCAPQPALPLSEVAPDVLERFEAQRASGCRLLRIETDGNGDGVVDDVAHFDPPVGDLPSSFAYAWESPRKPYESRGEQWVGIAHASRSEELAGGLQLNVDARSVGSTARQHIERTYDASHRLVREAHRWNDGLWFELDVTWRDGRMVGATFVDRVNAGSRPGPFLWTFAWTWDDGGHLVRGEVAGGRDPDATASVDWSYDAAGRPVRAERRENGALWLVQSWTFDEAGHLLSRRTEQSGLSWGPQQALDDLRPQQLLASSLGQAMWDDALPREDGSCTRLPSAAGHGYPGAEAVYDLGWPFETRPQGMGFDYGYDGYAYGYGESAWFGHGGVAGGSDPRGLGDELRTEVTYDTQGRAVREALAAAVEGQVVFQAVRERRFEGDLLVEDVRTVEDVRSVGDAPDARSSSIRWDYDDAGRILTRAYLIDDTLVAEHTWRYDPWGGISRHTIAHHGSDYGAFVGQEWSWEPAPPPVAEIDGPPPLRWTHEHVRSDGGRHVVKQKRDARTDEASVYGEEQWDDDGRLLATFTYGAGEHFGYDESGRLELHGWDFDDDGTLDRSERRVRDDADRLTLFETVDVAAGKHAAERFFYACP